MNILVLGASGMAGHVIATYLSEAGYTVKTISATKKLSDTTLLLDVTNISELRRHLSGNSYDVIINCIGVLVKQSEARKDLATFLNSYLPHFLEDYYRNSTTKVIHLSTDCVFSGKNAPYKEDSPYDGELFYDRSKALGEIINDKDLTFRMSIIGPDMQKDGIGLFNWFYAQTGVINGYTNVIWSGITTIELAKGIDAGMRQGLTGLYHLVPNKSISKHNLLKLFIETFEREDIDLGQDTSITSDKTLLNTRIDFDYAVPSYEVMLKEMREWIYKHQAIYEHYQ